MSSSQPASSRVYRLKRRRSSRRGVALIMVLGALTILTVMLTEFQDETSAEFGSALSSRDALKAEYAAVSAMNLSRLLIATEPTVRKAVAPLFLLMRRGPPQIAVWQFADRVLGAFNDEAGTKAFADLAGVDIQDGRNLGLEGAGFEVTIVDEDSKININTPARGDAFSQTRLAAQLIGLIGPPQYDAMFSQRDAAGQFSDRQSVCSAIVDWADPDQDGFVCDPHSETAQQTAPEDGYYELLKQPYQRKNAAFDSLDELHLVRGVGDDFWATFVDPDPDNPDKRIVTVWGQGKINVNSANPQIILAIVCGNAQPGTPLCTDPTQAQGFLTVMSMVRGAVQSMGAPLFSSSRAFVNAVKGKGMFGIALAAANIQPVQLLSESEMLKAVTTESKVFSIYATGVVKSGKRETRVRIHSVVDFRGAPPPGAPPGLMTEIESARDQLPANAPDPEVSGGASLPEGATADALAALLKPSPAGNIVYYRIE